MANGSLNRKKETDDIINGFNISSGTTGNVSFNSITLALVVQSGTGNNGIAIATLWNGMNKSNGIQSAGLRNKATYNRSVQISLSNSTASMKGLQIGVANYVNEHIVGLQIGIFNKSNSIRTLEQ